jgi:hexosaminidase
MNYLKILMIAGIIYAFLSCKAETPRPEVKIIPQPALVINLEGSFTFKPETKIEVNQGDEQFMKIASFLTNHIDRFYGIKSSASQSETAAKNSIYLKLDENSGLGKEAYNLTVTPKGVIIVASAPNGLFYGVQTLIQLMPPSQKKLTEVILPAVEIKDTPRFAWRGLHLDAGRHFMPKDFVLKYIDYMAMHKFNTFHWHLTEDQGWRIEIKKYPKLTEIGSVRKETLIGHGRDPKNYDKTPYGGFYTQEDVKEIVAYAAERYITVVPEIEMPGHSLAALASYPELGCTGGPYEVATRWGIFDDVYCAGKEQTFTFLQDVISEILPLFPSQYIHIGGDECPKTRWKKCPLCQKRMKELGLTTEHELQSYFVQRMEKFLNENGKKLIGWDEILEGGLAPNAAVMSWRGEEGGIAAAKQHHFVVMTPGKYCYLDHYQADPKTEPLAIGGFLPLEQVYSYDPVPASLTKEEASYIMGAQGNVWTEYMKTPEYVEYMVYPRAAALAEVVWSPKESKNYASFKNRLIDQLKRYDAYGINYCKAEFK